MPANPHPLVIVRSSPIAGKGAFARQPIAKGVVIIEYTGHRRKPRRSDLQGHADPAYHFWLRAMPPSPSGATSWYRETCIAAAVCSSPDSVAGAGRARPPELMR